MHISLSLDYLALILADLPEINVIMIHVYAQDIDGQMVLSIWQI